MSPRLGTLNYAQESGYQKNFSEKTNKIIDEEIRRVLNEQYANCKKLLGERKDIIEKLAERLLEKETLSLPDIVDIMGPRPFPLKETLKDYLQELKDRQEEEEKLKEEELKAQTDKREANAAAIAFDADAEEGDEEKEEAKEEKKAKSEEEKADDSQKEEIKSEDDKNKKE